jgi:hypothetical protein
MSPEDAFKLARQFSILGRDLQACGATIEITENLPFLGIKAGTYPMASSTIISSSAGTMTISDWSDWSSDTVNFDWYHPPYAYRYTLGEIIAMVGGNAGSPSSRLKATKLSIM